MTVSNSKIISITYSAFFFSKLNSRAWKCDHRGHRLEIENNAFIRCIKVKHSPAKEDDIAERINFEVIRKSEQEEKKRIGRNGAARTLFHVN